MANIYQNEAFEKDSFKGSSSEEEDEDSEAYAYVRERNRAKGWDVFRSTEDEAGSASEANTDLIEFFYKGLKIVTMAACFLVVLCSSVISKGATFFMVAQASTEDKYLEYCPKIVDPSLSTVNGTFYAVNTNKEKVSWLWCIFFSFAATEVFTFLRSLRISLMRFNAMPHIFDFSVVMLFETFHVIGLALLFFVVFPSMDSLRGIMITHAVGIFPAILKLFKRDEGFSGKMKIISRVLTGISLIIQISALVIWPILDINKKEIYNIWALPLGLFLTSFGWWESFVEEDSIKPLKLLWLLKTKMIDGGSRYITYTIISLWKIALFLGALIIIAPVNQVVPDVNFLFDNFVDSFKSQNFFIRMKNGTSGSGYIDLPNGLQNTHTAIHPMWVLGIQIAFAYIAHIFSKFSCKCGIQWQCFALPLNLVIPVCMTTLIPMCVMREKNPCIYGDGTSGGIPPNLFFECPAKEFNENWLIDYHTWIWVLWLLSQIWITIHAWRPRNRRLASTEQLFGTPFYNSLLLEQSMLLNRRSDNGLTSRRFDFKHKKVKEAADLDEVDETEVKQKSRKISALSLQKSDLTEDGDIRSKDSTSRVFGCATMWHENAEEITEMLKSIFRIDEDYSARFLAKKILDINDPDFYEWQTHIFFDDCMELSDDPNEPDEQQANQFVRLLVKMVDIVGKKWYGSRHLKVPYPTKYPTPYGGRLVWTLPGKTQIICHLKDKNKIRHKKRWSQIMYMYYFLGHQLMDNPKLTASQKDVRAENTYLLALDGDVDFQPDAIIKLVDLMKRNPDVGASCGRIHPTGSGFMQWYQMFEYAIGHWFQKATEHIMGCVLCSPGCFSLFRAKAVMDDNVMNTYTTVATQPRHFVQYDQGEDRWLCTLLLQQGWRVEYSAASDSFTACPEGFKEFYNQRRRWMPSTLANIADLLQDWRRVVKNNDNISVFFIAYQIMMMVGTVLGPGSILLMLVGAFNIAFHISNDLSMLINCSMVGVFIVACIVLKSDHQIAIALLLSVAYALIMMAVLVGMILQISEDGWLAPTTLSLLFVAGCFILAGIMHPQEIACLPMGVIYYITVPSMYLLLVIYSIFNLNNVSWGTREVPKKLSQQEQEEQQKNAAAQQEAAKKGSGLLGYFTSIAEKKKKGNMEIAFGNIFSCLCFTSEDQTDPKKELLMMADKLDKIEKALRIQEPERNTLESIRGAVRGTTSFLRKKSGTGVVEDREEEDSEPENQNEERRGSQGILKGGMQKRPIVKLVVETPQRDDMVNPFWIEDPNLGDGKIKKIPKHEVIFWREMVEKYLKPLDKNPEKEKQISEGLKELRNQSAFSFIMLNAIWVILIYLLQKEKDMLNVPWYFTEHPPTITFSDDISERGTIHIEKKVLQLEPIGFVFMIFFGFVMLVQLIGMMMHRIMTVSHIVSSTHITMGKKAPLVGDDYLAKNGVNMVKEWQNNYQGGSESGEQVSLETAVEKTLNALTSDDPNLLRRVSDIDQMSSNMPSLRRTETKAALKRRNTAHQKRKATVRRKPASDTIKEEDETESRPGSFYEKVPVDRTKSRKDPHGMDERDV